ncbi:acyltransferase [uncultured Sphingomonas sp.]|uniref:acyltransferase family protein n=1 Tax=uncultured Sphingomonas sp. TaxID=158754 RepID=UPI0025F57A5D|nr:acyltransferase [uncultured Sphingomonas sp.]
MNEATISHARCAALRGVAAIAVYFHHSNGISAPLGMSAGYRAVDLFFILSGFVIAHAYEEKLRRDLTPLQLTLLRIARIYPLYLVGLIIGAGGAFLAVLLHGGDLSMHVVVVSTVAMLFLLPSPATNAFMPLNVPAWSLFFELLANAIYAQLAKVLNNRRLILLIGAAAAILTWLSVRAGTTNMGVEWSGFVGGVMRVLFSFFAGILLYRVRPRRILHTPWAWILPLIALPSLYLASEELIPDLLCVFVVFPTMIWLGSAVELPTRRVANFLGDTSYGLYVIHVPMILLSYKTFSYFGSDANRFAPWTGLILLAALLPGIYILDRIYDQPVRSWVAAKVRSRFRG